MPYSLYSLSCYRIPFAEVDFRICQQFRCDRGKLIVGVMGLPIGSLTTSIFDESLSMASGNMGETNESDGFHHLDWSNVERLPIWVGCWYIKVQSAYNQLKNAQLLPAINFFTKLNAMRIPSILRIHDSLGAILLGISNSTHVVYEARNNQLVH